MSQVRSRERVQRLGEVFTSPREVALMLDMLNGDAEDPDCRILEPSCGNGNFLVEIVRRRAGWAASPAEAVKGVLGVDICEDNVLEARERMADVLRDAYQNEMSEDEERAALALISLNVRVGDFLTSEEAAIACDVIVGNPPYQEMDGGFGSSARPLYHKFFDRSRRAALRKVCLIIPARWYSGGKGLDAFRASMLADRTVARIVDWENSSDCFPGVDISGGICVVLTDSAHDGDCLFEQRRGGETVSRACRDLREAPVLIRDNAGAEIVRKAMAGRAPLSATVRPRNSFGMATNFVPAGAGDIRVLTNSGWRAHDSSLVEKRREAIGQWKVFVSGSAFEHAGAAGKDGKRRVLSRIIITGPGTAATETYVLVDAFDSEAAARALASYLSTRTARYLVSLAASSHHITRDRFRFVPALTVSGRADDAALARLFGLTDDEQRRITDTIRDWPQTDIPVETPE